MSIFGSMSTVIISLCYWVHSWSSLESTCGSCSWHLNFTEVEQRRGRTELAVLFMQPQLNASRLVFASLTLVNRENPVVCLFQSNVSFLCRAPTNLCCRLLVYGLMCVLYFLHSLHFICIPETFVPYFPLHHIPIFVHWPWIQIGSCGKPFTSTSQL